MNLAHKRHNARENLVHSERRSLSVTSALGLSMPWALAPTPRLPVPLEDLLPPWTYRLRQVRKDRFRPPR
jgi:hypothetical protein